MQNDEIRDYWRWRMFRQVAEFIHNPDDINKTKLANLLDTYQQERSGNNPLECQECSVNAL